MLPTTTSPISVLVRSLGNADHLDLVLGALRAQECSFPFEIVVVECNPDQRIKQLCQRENVELMSLTEDEFVPGGRSLNRGLQKVAGDLIVVLGGLGTLPVGPFFLESCVEPFSDPQVAAARCLSLESERQVEQWFEPTVIQYESSKSQQKVESGDGWDLYYPSTACCVLRREAWQQIPFDEEMELTADKKWASETLANGWKMVACADAMWISVTNRTAEEVREIRLTQQIGYYQLTGRRPLSWPGFILQSSKIVLISPVIAARFLFEQLASHLDLLTIPLQARIKRESGSIAEFDRHA